MTAPTYLDYCYGEEVEIDSFCRLPRILVTNEFYCTIPSEIKILYALMLDRVAMSMRNNWREDRRVFIYFTLQNTLAELCAECVHKGDEITEEYSPRRNLKT